MSDNKKRPRLKMVGSSRVTEPFLDDLETFLNIEKGPRRELLEFYTKRKNPLSSIEDTEQEELARLTSLPKQVIEDVGSLMRFLLKQIALRDVTLDDIVEDLQSLGYESEKVEVGRVFLSAILAAHENLKQDARRALSANSIIDTVESLGFSTDVRAIYDDDENLIDVVPVLIVRMVLEGLEKKREMVFQLSEEKLDQFYEMLVKQKSKLKEISDKINLDGGTKE